MLIDICIKFREYSLSGFQVIERTRFVTDRQTDGQTDGQTDARGKTICLPTLKGGDIITSGPSAISAGLFVCFVALHPKSTAMVMTGRSVHLTTLFPGQA